MPLRHRWTVLLASSAAVVLAACQQDNAVAPPVTPSKSSSNAVVQAAPVDSVPLDTKLLEVEKLSPGFAGIYWENPTSLVVAHTDSSALEPSLTAIRQVMGDIPALHAAHIRLRRVKFSFRQLDAFRRAMEARTHASGFVVGGIDEAANHVRFGVESDAVASAVRAGLQVEGIPDSAVATEVVKPHRPTSYTLWNRDTANAGGLYIEQNNGDFCSLGFNFTRWGTSQYMMTAAHCAQPVGSVSSSLYYSNDATRTLQEAQEYSDPAPSSTVVNCMSGRLCRNADAVVFQWTASSQVFGLGLIASPDTAVSGWSTHGGVTFSSYYNIVGEAPDSWLIQGAQVSKVGVQSGLTRGTVTQACQTWYAYYTLGADFTCQVQTNVQVLGGDSGGPLVYGWPSAGGSVYLAGLTSNSDGATESMFSTWSAIVREFGNVKTYPSKPCC